MPRTARPKGSELEEAARAAARAQAKQSRPRAAKVKVKPDRALLAPEEATNTIRELRRNVGQKRRSQIAFEKAEQERAQREAARAAAKEKQRAQRARAVERKKEQRERLKQAERIANKREPSAERAQREPAGVKLRQRINAIFAGKQFELVRADHDPRGIHDVMGNKTKRYVVLRNCETGEKIIAGLGLARRHAGITLPPSRPPGRPPRRPAGFLDSFAAEGYAAVFAPQFARPLTLTLPKPDEEARPEPEPAPVRRRRARTAAPAPAPEPSSFTDTDDSNDLVREPLDSESSEFDLDDYFKRSPIQA